MRSKPLNYILSANKHGEFINSTFGNIFLIEHAPEAKILDLRKSRQNDGGMAAIFIYIPNNFTHVIFPTRLGFDLLNEAEEFEISNLGIASVQAIYNFIKPNFNSVSWVEVSIPWDTERHSNRIEVLNTTLNLLPLHINTLGIQGSEFCPKRLLTLFRAIPTHIKSLNLCCNYFDNYLLNTCDNFFETDLALAFKSFPKSTTTLSLDLACIQSLELWQTRKPFNFIKALIQAIPSSIEHLELKNMFHFISQMHSLGVAVEELQELFDSLNISVKSLTCIENTKIINTNLAKVILSVLNSIYFRFQPVLGMTDFNLKIKWYIPAECHELEKQAAIYLLSRMSNFMVDCSKNAYLSIQYCELNEIQEMGLSFTKEEQQLMQKNVENLTSLKRACLFHFFKNPQGINNRENVLVDLLEDIDFFQPALTF